MAVTTTALRRVFRWKHGAEEVDLPDPGATYSPEQVKDVYLDAYPGMANAAVSGPEVDGGSAVYTFVSSVGTKG